MEIHVRAAGAVTVVELVGELTWKTAPEAQAQILAAAAPGGKMILDMSGVSYMSSAGLRLLLVVYRTIAGRGGQVRLAALSEDMRNTMEVVGFLDFFKHSASVEDGIAALAP